MSDRRNFTDRMKEIIFHSCDGHCFYCGKALSFKNHAPGKYTIGWGSWQIEHLASYSEGGSSDLGNVAAACVDCNQLRAEQYQKRGDHSTKSYMMQQFGRVRCHGFNPGKKRCQNNTDGSLYCYQHNSYDRYKYDF